MTNTPQARIGQLIREYVAEGEPNDPQQHARAHLNILMQAMVAKHPKPDAPTSVRECVDRVQASAEKDHPGFVFDYDPRLLDAEPLKRERTPA